MPIRIIVAVGMCLAAGRSRNEVSCEKPETSRITERVDIFDITQRWVSQVFRIVL